MSQWGHRFRIRRKKIPDSCFGKKKRSYFSGCTSIMKQAPFHTPPIIYRLSLRRAEAWRSCVMCFCFTSRLWKSAFYGQALWYVFRAIREEIYWLIMAGQVQRGESHMYKRCARAPDPHAFTQHEALRPLKVLSSSCKKAQSLLVCCF